MGFDLSVNSLVKCPTLGPAHTINTPWYPLVSHGRGIVGHIIDRCINDEKDHFPLIILLICALAIAGNSTHNIICYAIE